MAKLLVRLDSEVGSRRQNKSEDDEQHLRQTFKRNTLSHEQPIKFQTTSAEVIQKNQRTPNNPRAASDRISNATPFTKSIIIEQNNRRPRRQARNRNQCIISALVKSLIAVAVARITLTVTSVHHLTRLVEAYKSSGGSSERMVRLCIASVDPIKLSSQCVMCNRREFPLTVIDCTGITKVNDLVASPLSVQEATCLIYNCRRQVPEVKPEPYHGSASQAVNYRTAASNYHPSGMSGGGAAGIGVPVAGSSVYEMMAPSGMLGDGYAVQSPLTAASPFMTRFGLRYGASSVYGTSAAASALSPFASLGPRGLIGGPNLNGNRQQALPYALVQAPSFPFGSRKYKAALVPLFK